MFESNRLARAIVARFAGVFDDPDLMSFGVLSSSPSCDVERFAAAVLASSAPEPPPTPLAIADALAMVAKHHSDVVRVLFFEDANLCGVWQYQDRDGNCPSFSDNVDVYALEEALDAAEALGLPCVFETPAR